MEQTRRRKILASVAAIALAASAAITIDHATNTDASFVDRVFGTGVFDVDYFNIEGAIAPGNAYSDHVDATSAANLTGSITPGTVAFATPMDLVPDRTVYAPLFLRTKTHSSAAASITMSTAQKAPGFTTDTPMWDRYVTYGARALLPSDNQTCDATTFSSARGISLVPLNSPMTRAPSGSFSLPAASNTSPGAPAVVCFAFTLSSTVVAGSPASNGKSIYPLWTFTGQS